MSLCVFNLLEAGSVQRGEKINNKKIKKLGGGGGERKEIIIALKLYNLFERAL